jgi:3-phosphoshikimate 1-carboxyvinyltransferase
MIAALRALGATVDDTGATWSVTPPTGRPDHVTVDCGLAGTVMRFVPPLAALGPGHVTFTGADRPIAPLLDGLAQLGAHVEGETFPFTVSGPARGGGATIDASGSSQFVSGLLLAGARFPAGLELCHDGPPIPSLPHIQMTIDALALRGVEVEAFPCPPRPDGDRSGDATTRDTATPRHGESGPTRWRVSPGPIGALDDVIEPDLTTAAGFLAAALIARGSVTIPGWPARTSQPGFLAPDVLTRFGGHWTLGPGGLTVTGDGALAGQDVDLHAVSELTPVVAALGALASGRTVIRGVAHIRGHETNRLAALAREITALGGHAAETADGLVIEQARLHGGRWRTHGDHRMAHAGALVGLRVPGVALDDVGVTAKTMPGFEDAWWELLA